MWSVRFEDSAAQALSKLDKLVQRRIKALTGPYASHCRYRVVDWRVICRIFRGNLVIRVVELGHRSRVYD